MKLADYFDRTSIIHLPDRKDRYRALAHELRILGMDILTLVANPVMSVQKGSRGSIADGRWYDHFRLERLLANTARAGKDECWRRTGWYVCGTGVSYELNNGSS